jgi:hypothetical protein
MPEKTRFKMPKRDPYLKAYVAATTAFDSMVRVTPARMTAFINAKIGDRGELHSSEIKVETIEELLAFRSLRAALGSAASTEIGSYRVVVEDGRTDNEWINLPSFRIERAASEAA